PTSREGAARACRSQSQTRQEMRSCGTQTFTFVTPRAANLSRPSDVHQTMGQVCHGSYYVQEASPSRNQEPYLSRRRFAARCFPRLILPLALAVRAPVLQIRVS